MTIMRRSPSELDVIPVKRVRSDANVNPTIVSSFQQLPNEVLLEIFGFLDLYKLTNAFSGISQRYDSLLSSVTSFSLVIKNNNINFIGKSLLRHAASIARLVIDEAENFIFSSMTLVNIRSLTIKYGTREQYDSIRPSHFPLLEYLHVTDSKYYFSLGKLSVHHNFPLNMII